MGASIPAGGGHRNRLPGRVGERRDEVFGRRDSTWEGSQITPISAAGAIRDTLVGGRETHAGAIGTRAAQTRKQWRRPGWAWKCGDPRGRRRLGAVYRSTFGARGRGLKRKLAPGW